MGPINTGGPFPRMAAPHPELMPTAIGPLPIVGVYQFALRPGGPLHVRWLKSAFPISGLATVRAPGMGIPPFQGMISGTPSGPGTANMCSTNVVTAIAGPVTTMGCLEKECIINDPVGIPLMPAQMPPTLIAKR